MSAAVATGLPQIEDIYEAFDDELGSWMGVLIAGHHDDETAAALTWAYILDEGRDSGTLGAPVRTWVRKVPRSGGYMAYVYGGPGRGASPVTRIEQASGWTHWCDVPRCRWQFVPGSTRVGVPRINIINGDELGSQPQHRDREYVYLCRDHYRRYEEDLRAARKKALDDYYAGRAAS